MVCSTFDAQPVQRKGSYGGVAFHVDATDESYGHRIITHEFPLRNSPFNEKMGTRHTTFSISGYFVGASQLSERDALISVVKGGGPKTLVHPFYSAPTSCVATALKVRHSKDQLGRIDFTLELVEDNGSSIGSIPILSIATSLEASVDGLIGSALSGFEATVDLGLKGAAEFTQSAIENGASLLDEIRLGVSIDSTIAPDLDFSIGALFSNASDISRGKASLSTYIDPVVSNLRLGASGQDIARGLRDIREFGLDFTATRFPGAASKVAEDLNYTTTAATFRRVFGALQGEFSANTEWPKRSEALEAMNSYAVWSDLERGRIPSGMGEVYEDFDRCVSNTMRMFNRRSTDLTPRIEIVTPSAMPSIVAAYRYYDDPSKAQELWESTNSPHPSFLPNQLTLEISQ